MANKYTAKRGINKHDSVDRDAQQSCATNGRFINDFPCASINAAKRLIREWPTLDNATVERLVADYDDQS